MAVAAIVYEDQWGSIIDHPDKDYIEIHWYDSTDAMSAKDFQQWLALFAGYVEKARRSGILTDSTSFLMDRNNLDGDWRDKNIVPRYNSAGVNKFAFHMPQGMPAIGAPPTYEGPAKYLTAYFGRRQDALDWLVSSR